MLVLGTKSNTIFNIDGNIKTKKKIKPVNWFGYVTLCWKFLEG